MATLIKSLTVKDNGRTLIINNISFRIITAELYVKDNIVYVKRIPFSYCLNN